MDPRYALLSWDEGGASQARSAMEQLGRSQRWRLHEATSSAALYSLDGADPPSGSLQADQIILGDLFSRESGAPVDGSGISNACTPEARAHRLCSSMFGRYVALFADQSASWRAFRDPSGGVEALTWRSDRLSVIASELDDEILQAAPTALTLDWDRLALYAHQPLSLGVGSGFAHVHAIDPGGLGGFAEGRFRQTQVWRPADYLDLAKPPPKEAGAALRAAVALAVGAYEPQAAVAEISGGLDSAIIAQARAGGSGPTEWLTYFGDEAEADERAYARLVAERLGLSLAEVFSPPQVLDVEQVLEVAFGPRPAMNGLDAHMDCSVSERAAAFGAQIILTGQGGDAVFFRSRTALIGADALHRKLGTKERVQIFLNLSHWTRRSIWSVGREAIRARFGGAIDQGDGFNHPWLDLPPETPPAKRMHVAQILAGQAFNGASRRGRAAKLVHPLLSQPVVEVCLGLATYTLTAGRRDRALARATFAPSLPTAIVQRRSKGDMTRHYGQMIARSLGELRPFLMDGLLANKGILDRSALDAQLSPEELIWRGDYAALLQWVTVEAWARRWSERAT